MKKRVPALPRQRAEGKSQCGPEAVRDEISALWQEFLQEGRENELARRNHESLIFHDECVREFAGRWGPKEIWSEQTDDHSFFVTVILGDDNKYEPDECGPKPLKKDGTTISVLITKASSMPAQRGTKIYPSPSSPPPTQKTTQKQSRQKTLSKPARVSARDADQRQLTTAARSQAIAAPLPTAIKIGTSRTEDFSHDTGTPDLLFARASKARNSRGAIGRELAEDENAPDFDRLRKIILSYCDVNDVSYRELSRLIGNPGIIADIMKGRSRWPRKNTLRRLAEILKIKFSDLIGTGPLPTFSRTTKERAAKPTDKDMVRIPSGEIKTKSGAGFIHDGDVLFGELVATVPSMLALAHAYLSANIRTSRTEDLVLYLVPPDLFSAPNIDDRKKMVIREGDLVLVDVSVRLVREPGIYLVYDGDESRLVEFVRAVGQRVIGRAVWIGRTL